MVFSTFMQNFVRNMEEMFIKHANAKQYLCKY